MCLRICASPAIWPCSTRLPRPFIWSWTISISNHRKSLTDAFGEEVGGEIWGRFTVHHTPTHGSWLHQAEIEISLLARQCLGTRRIPNLKTLRGEVRLWNRRMNQAQQKIQLAVRPQSRSPQIGLQKELFQAVEDLGPRRGRPSHPGPAGRDPSIGTWLVWFGLPAAAEGVQRPATQGTAFKPGRTLFGISPSSLFGSCHEESCPRRFPPVPCRRPQLLPVAPLASAIRDQSPLKSHRYSAA
jgi:hypothetical protein